MLLMAALFVAGGTARADEIMIDFMGTHAGGTLSYGGGTAPLIGTGLVINTVAGVNTPANNNSGGTNYGVVGQNGTGFGILEFQTGSGFGPAPNIAWRFNGGGYFRILGAVLNEDGTTGVGYRTLLDGNLLGATVERSGSVKLVISEGTDRKDPDLVRFFGMDPETHFAFSGGIQVANYNYNRTTQGFTASSAGNTHIVNTALVPEPASLALLGSVILFLGLKLRKKLL